MIRTPEQLCKMYDHEKAERSTNWETHWQEIADYIVPRKNDINNFKTPGSKRNIQILDNTGMSSNELLAGMLHGFLINPATEFFELQTGNPVIDQSARGRLWLQETVSRMHAVMNNSNFQTEAYEFLLDLCSINTASQTVLEDQEKVVFFQTHFIKQLFIRENSRGQVVEQFLSKELSPQHLVEEYGIKNVPDCVKQDFEAGKETKYEIFQATYPADPFGQKKKNFRFPIVSQHILVKEKFELKLEGFNEMPWVCSRWAKASGEKYGRGPGMNALPEVKMVNLMEETMIKGAQLTIGPPVQMPDDGMGSLRLKPWGVNYYRAGSKDRIEPIFRDTRLDFGIEIMESHRKRIREAFYVEQLQLPPKLDRATAAEISQRRDESGRFLGPLLARLEVEWLNPLVDRVYAIMERRGQFEKPPQELIGKRLKVRYSSAIAKVQRQGDIRGVMEFLNSVAPLAQISPDVLHWINTDATVNGLAAMFSYPQKFLNDEDEVAKIRQAMAQAAEKQQAQAQEMHDAEVAGTSAPAVSAAADLMLPPEG